FPAAWSRVSGPAAGGARTVRRAPRGPPSAGAPGCFSTGRRVPTRARPRSVHPWRVLLAGSAPSRLTSRAGRRRARGLCRSLAPLGPRTVAGVAAGGRIRFLHIDGGEPRRGHGGQARGGRFVAALAARGPDHEYLLQRLVALRVGPGEQEAAEAAF